MLVLPIPASAASASGNDVAIGNPMLAVPSNDGGLGMMPQLVSQFLSHPNPDSVH